MPSLSYREINVTIFFELACAEVGLRQSLLLCGNCGLFLRNLMRKLFFAAVALSSRLSTSMLFNPSGNRTLWDQAGLIAPKADGGSYRMWFDNQGCAGTVSRALCDYGVATSPDGVFWTDRPDSDMRPFDMPAAIGSGSVWQSPTDSGLWVVNYSEGNQDEGGQQIRFQTTRNATLLGPWTPRPDVAPFRPNATAGYNVPGRWDTITAVRYNGSMYGWWTASPLPLSPTSPMQVGMGFGVSRDGVHWEALAPAWLVTDNRVDVTTSGFEVGGVALVETAHNGSLWYAFACNEHEELPAAIGGYIGCFTFVSAAPGGPYHLAERNYGILAYRQHGHNPEYAYYCRFFHNQNQNQNQLWQTESITKGAVSSNQTKEQELLVNYQVYDAPHWKQKQDPSSNHTKQVCSTHYTDTYTFSKYKFICNGV